jgi:putative addiction module killer protein
VPSIGVLDVRRFQEVSGVRRKAVTPVSPRSSKSGRGDWIRTSDPLRPSGKRDATAAAKITTSVRRLELGNFSNVKGVGAGVFEYRIDFGPGYRVYFGKDGDALVILLGGGTKKGPGSGHRNGAHAVEGLQEAQVAGDVTMPLTREFKETVQARIRQDR